MPEMTRFDPFAELRALQRQFFGESPLSPLKNVNIPTTDVYTKDSALIVEAHLPNFEQKDIDISVDKNVLVVSAERHEKTEDQGKQYLVRESSSSFYRRIALPERVNTEQIRAQLDDGVLRIEVPLVPLPEPKKVTIESRTPASAEDQAKDE